MAGSRVVSAIAASAITLAVALAALGMILDVSVLLRHAGTTTIVATAAVVVSLAVFAAVLAAPPLALVAWAMRHTRGRRWEVLWPLAAFVAGTGAALLLSDAF